MNQTGVIISFQSSLLVATRPRLRLRPDPYDPIIDSALLGVPLGLIFNDYTILSICVDEHVPICASLST